jgi:hypothetical protein
VTEEDYFKSFPYYHSLGNETCDGQFYSHKGVHIEAGAGQHSKVVEKAEKVFKKFCKEYGTIKPSEVWCVFDCDNDIDALKSAVQAAEKRHFNPIYTIQCFELWFLLHFQNLSTAIGKEEYDKRVSRFLNIEYEHGTRGMYQKLVEYQDKALSIATNMWDQKNNANLLFEDPITNVHKLVIELNQAYANLKKRS